MTDSSHLESLVRIWQQSCQRGEPLSAEDLCRDCPELLPALQRRMRDLVAATEAPELQNNFSAQNTKAQASAGEADVTAAHKPGLVFKRPPRQAGRYEIREVIARGGMGVVYRAFDPLFQRLLAVKILLPAADERANQEQRFLAEARISGQLQHPGIPPVHDVGRLGDGRPFLAMKLIEGKTLAELLKQPQPHPGEPAFDTATDSRFPTRESRWLGIFEHICQTLAYAHARGVIHRDLKPQNIMVGAFGEVQVMDWGLAKRMKDEGGRMNEESDSSFILHPSSFQTQPGKILGTPAFMAPEQARGDVDQLDERCDVFGLGAILCVMLTGEPPFSADSVSDALHQSSLGDLTDAFAALDGCGADDDLLALAKQCLAARMDDRPRDAGVVAEAVASYQALLRDRLRQARLKRQEADIRAVEERKRRQVERQRSSLLIALLAAGVLLLLGAGGAGIWYFREQARQEREQFRRETDERLALERTETEIRLALERAAALRRELHTDMRKPGVVYRLLNQPEHWGGRINSAHADVRRARSLQKSAKRPIAPALLAKLDALESQLGTDHADWQLAERLEAVRLKRLAVTLNDFDYRASAAAYPIAFQKAGIDALTDAPEKVAARIAGSPIRELLIAGLDDWSIAAAKDKQAKVHRQLVTLVKLVDADPERNRLRDAAMNEDREELARLVAVAPIDRLSPSFLTYVGRKLTDLKLDDVSWLRAAQKMHPDDFGLNFNLAIAIGQKNPAEAIGFIHAAIAVRPENSYAWYSLGVSYLKAGRRSDAIGAFERTLQIEPEFHTAHFGIGVAHFDAKEFAKAVAAYRRAIKTKENYAPSHYNLGITLKNMNDLSGAAASLRRAVQLRPNYYYAWLNLGNVLTKAKDWDGAVQAFRKAVALKPKTGTLHSLLAQALLHSGRFAEAEREAAQALKLLPAGSKLRPATQRMVTRSKMLLSLEKKLPSVLAGKSDTSAQEKINLAVLCWRFKKHYRDAVAVYTKAFAQGPALADNLEARHRFLAACAAASAAAGAGKQANQLTTADKSKFVEQALDWLQADLDAYEKRLKDNDPLGTAMTESLRKWRNEPLLAGIRDTEYLKRLDSAEQARCRQLWSEHERILEQARRHMIVDPMK